MADRRPIRAGIRQTQQAPMQAVPQMQMPDMAAQGVTVTLPQEQRAIDRGMAYPSAPELYPTQMREVADVGIGGQAGLGVLSTLTFSQDEMLDMLRAADPNIVSERGPQGEIYVHRPGGNRYVLNRPGVSGMDAIQIGASILGTTPQTFLAKTPLRRILYDVATETAIQGGQQLSGGQFDVGDPLSVGGMSAGSEVIPVIRGAQTRGRAAEAAERRVGETGAQMVEATAMPETVRQQRFVEIVDPDPAVVQAAQELGLQDVLPPKVYSRNQQYIEFEQAMRRTNTSDLANIDRTALEAVNSRADQFLSLFGGQRDIAGLSETIRGDISNTIAESHILSNSLYDQLGEMVPARALVDNTEIRKYLENRALDLGGADKLSQIERRLYNEVRGSRRMTYARIDDLRKTIGENLSQAYRGAPLGDNSTYKLSDLYSTLTDAQGGAIEQVAGTQARNLWDVAKSTVAQRKALEESAQTILGKELMGEAMPKLVANIRRLQQGETKQFIDTLNAVPERLRQEAVVSAIGQMFEAGARRAGLNMGGYSSWWNKVKRQPTALRAMNLDTDMVKFLDNLSIISEAYSKAQGAVPPTGVVQAIMNVAGKDGFMNKLFGVPMVGRPMKILFGEAANPDLVAATNALMENAAFGRLVERAASGQTTDRLEARLAQTPVVKAWLAELPPATAQRISAVGLGRYFFGGTSEDKE